MFTIIKASGTEFLPKNFPFFCEFLTTMQKEKKNIILVFGGGVQIDKFYFSKFQTERPKNNGMGITTKEVMEHGVLPSYENAVQLLQNAFSNVLLHRFESITGKRKEAFGKVIEPTSIILNKESSFQAFGFIGKDENNENCNINADDIVQILAKEESVKSIIFLTQSGGLYNINHKCIPFLSGKDIEKLLHNTYPNASVSDGMIKKCEVIQEILKTVPTVLIRSSKNNSLHTICEKLPEVLPVYASRKNPFVSGKGSYLYTQNGEKYLDMMSGVAVNILGHSDEEWKKSVINQLEKCVHISNYYISEPQQLLAQKLVEHSFADQVFFSNSGTEANEAALKFTKKYAKKINPEKTEIIAFKNGFHGRSIGSLSVTENPNYRLPFAPLVSDIIFAEYNNIDSFLACISEKTAGVIIEPIQGEGGVFSAEKEFLKRMRKECDDHNALLIFDEVQCGLGRTGTLFAYEHFDVIPDIITLAKPLAGGIPIGATLVKGKVGRIMQKGDHGSTFGGNPLACASAIHIVEQLEKPAFLQQVQENSEYLMQKLNNLQSSKIVQIRGKGLMIGIECTEKVQPMIDTAYEKKLLIISAGEKVIRLLPPLTVSKEEIDQACEILENIL